ncbi:MAG: hypothetical protein PVG39_00705 [Desulfobacteraceae bacterium]|jgi:hypothetical protein
MRNEHLFNRLISRYTPIFDKTMMYGVPLSELNADQLRAAICALNDLEKATRMRIQKERNFFKRRRK